MRFVVAGGLLAGPVAIAFFSGGQYDRPRAVAGVLAWALVALLALTGAPLPRSRAAVAALAGMVGLTAWAAVSMSWAPLGELARDDVARLILYTGTLLASAMAWHVRSDARFVEPALAGGVLLVALYGLSDRLLPSLIDLEASALAAGRLEQPLTYWNAMGALCAFGLVLAARVAGDVDRPPLLRAAAAAAGAPLGMATYLSFSRGAIAALVAGIVVLLALSPTRAQIRAVAVTVGAGLVAALVATRLPAVESLEGSSPDRDGAIALVVLLVLAGVAAWLTMRTSADDAHRYALPRRTVVVAALVALLVGAPFVALALDRGAASDPVESGATASRLNDLGSNRYDYWDVALDAWADDPLQGTGTAGFRVDWLRDRDIQEPVFNAHSLYIETAAELGLVGLGLLALLIGGVAVAAVAVARRDRDLAAGPIAGVCVFAVHAALDWDWEIPAVALPALVLAGLLLCRAEVRTAGGRSG